MSDNVISKYDKPAKSTLYNQDIDRLRMVVKTVNNFQTMPTIKLCNILQDKYTNKGTLSVISFTLKKFFQETNEARKAKFWGDVGQKLSTFVNREESKNELTNDEKNNWKSQKEIVDIMDNIEIKDRTDYNRFLILAMCTMQPPLRKAFYRGLKFATTTKELNKIDNFLYIPNQGKCYYVVNTDKVSKFDKFKENENKHIEILNENLCNILRDSYNQDKRTYVFTTEDGNPYSINSISILLLERPFKLNFNLLRSSYVSHYYDNHNTLRDKEDLARKMRHSVKRAMTSYDKPNAKYQRNF